MRRVLAMLAIALVPSITMAADLDNKPDRADRFKDLNPNAADLKRPSCTKNASCVSKMMVQAAHCLEPEDWKYVLEERQGCWWATDSDESPASTMFTSACGTLVMPAGSRTVAYQGRVTKKRYIFRFPRPNPK